jgi:hypothetical protein
MPPVNLGKLPDCRSLDAVGAKVQRYKGGEGSVIARRWADQTMDFWRSGGKCSPASDADQPAGASDVRLIDILDNLGYFVQRAKSEAYAG